MATALAAGALATTAGTAQAAPQQDDFTQGIHDKTALIAGGVEIAPDFATAFAGPALPSGWTPGNWAATGSVTANNGLTMSEAWARNDAPTHPGSSLQFRATFSQRGQHVGFGVDYNNGPWAIFSTGTTGDGVYARTNTGSSATDTATAVRVGDTGTAYDLRIDWTTGNEFVFFVDGVEKARHSAVGMPTSVKSLASDFFDGANTNLKVESMTLRTNTSGAFVSRVFDAGTAAVAGIDFTKTAASGLTYETSTSNDNVTWTTFSPGAIQPARYFKYRAIFSTTEPAVTPRLTAASVDFRLQTTDPNTGGTTGGSGTSGTGTTQPSGDTKKAKVGMPRDADVTKRGKVRILLTCPGDEQRCDVLLKLKWNGDTVASKSGKIDGGDSRYLSPKLSRAAKRKLAKAGKLKVLATLTVTDAAGNKRKSSRTIWLYPL